LSALKPEVSTALSATATGRRSTANSLFLRVFFAYSLTADVLPEGFRQ
jgi:hypothetical protein